MLVGGMGVTPMIQSLHTILGDANSDTKVSMLYGSKVAVDILGNEMLTIWSVNYSDKFSLTHVLSDEPGDSEWNGASSFIGKDLIQEHLPGAGLGEDVIIFICGPPPMYNALCGPRDEDELRGVLCRHGLHEGSSVQVLSTMKGSYSHPI